jgi:NosR/NirI family transcriptional regulator, nitrous oxide reductase regulator
VAIDVAKPEGKIKIPNGADPNLPPSRVRPPLAEGVLERFADSDSVLDLTGLPLFGPLLKRILRSRRYQFFIILPSQILFWLVIVAGIIGTVEPSKNFATAITWYIWFALMFPLTVILGRAWCLTCPFGGLGEWIQRKTLWARKWKPLGLAWKMPQQFAEYGLLMSVVMFLVLTWIEEFFNIAGPGLPILTSFMVLGIVGFALISFVLFERRTFCRYLCPLSSLIGVAGTTGVVAGFRPKDRGTCLNCQTKDCMRGGKEGYGCPWYVYPASSDTNSYCGLCSECYKACPYDNLSMYAQKPLTSVIAPSKKPVLAWVAAILFGLILFQQWNALPSYTAVDGWINNLTHFPSYPNPIDYIGAIAIAVGIFAGLAFLISRAISLKTRIARSFNSWFAPMMYGFIPLMGADYLARVMPKFFNHAPMIVTSVAGVFGREIDLSDFHILSADWLLRAQYIVVGLGTLLAVYALSRIARKDYKDLTKHSTLARVLPGAIAVLIGVGVITLYFFMNGAE